MDVKSLINSIDTKNFDISQTHPWRNLPPKFPDCDLDGLSSTEISKFMVIVTLWEMTKPEKPSSITRAWQDPEAYRFLVQYTNLVLLRILIRKFTSTLPKSEYRTKTQLDDAARSTVSNIEEGFRRPTTKEYLEYIGFTEGSLSEIKGDINKCLQDKFLVSRPGSSLLHLGINLKEWNEWVKNPTNSPKILQFPLKDSKGGYRNLEQIPGSALTYEIFIELINKSSFTLRKLVEALEKKPLNQKWRIREVSY